MRALVLAAGRGERMRPLTDTLAKPLLSVGGRRLIEWQIAALVRAGITDLVINTAHLAGQIESTLGDGERYGASIVYSREGDHAGAALETLGGIVRALPALGDAAFLVVSSDIVTDFDYGTLSRAAAAVDNGAVDAHLVLVPNPSYHPQGDMGITAAGAGGGSMATGSTGTLTAESKAEESTAASTAAVRATRTAPLHTYANIGVLAPRIFAGLQPVRSKLFPWLFGAVEAGRVGAELFDGRWWNVGTPEDLASVDRIWP